MQLAPQEYFTIVRQIEDPVDANAYYPQAEVRNARTDVLLETVDLESKGDQRYSERFQVPTDVLGLGFYISIVTKVYTDAGHTTESDNYGRTEQTHLVQERNRNLGGGGGGGGISSETLEKVLNRVVPKLINIPKSKKVDLKPLVKAIKEIPMLTVDRIEFPEVKFPEQKKVDLSPVLNKLDSNTKKLQDIEKAVDDIDVPDHIESFKAVGKLMSALKTNLESANIEKALELIPQLNEAIKVIPGHIEVVQSAQKALQENVISIRGLFNNSDPEKKEEAPKPITVDRNDRNRGVTRLMRPEIKT